MVPVCPVTPVDIPPDGSATESWYRCLRRPARTRSCAGHGRRRQLRPALLQPAHRILYVNAIDEPTIRAGRRKDISRHTIRQPASWYGRKSTTASARPGSVVTASDLVFVGSGSNTAGYFMAFHAKTGELLWKFNTGAGVFSSPSMYMVNGEQFVTVGSGGGDRGRRGGDLILSFALPKR